MSSQNDQGALLGVALAAAVAIVVGQGPFSWWSTITGLVLILFLHANHGGIESEPSRLKVLSYSAVWSLCCLLVIGVLLNFIGGEEVTSKNRLVADTGVYENISAPYNILNRRDLLGFIIWVGLTSLAFVVIRKRGLRWFRRSSA